MTMSNASLAMRLPETTGWPRSEPVIVDCTTLPRFGLRGPGSCRWLKSEGFAVPDAVNGACVTGQGTLVIRLGRDEAMISGLGTGRLAVEDVETRWASSEGAKGYDAFRRDGWAHLLISGSGTRPLMSEVTEIDLRPSAMPVGRVSQTRVLHMDAVIVRTDRFGDGAYEIFFDIASLAYAIEALGKGNYGHSFLSLEKFEARRRVAAA